MPVCLSRKTRRDIGRDNAICPGKQCRAVIVTLPLLALLVAACSEAELDDPDRATEISSATAPPVSPAKQASAPVAMREMSYVEREQEVTASFGKIEIRQIGHEGAAHAQPGHLDITYLDDDGNSAAQFLRAVRMGSWGRMGEWAIDDDFSQFPVIVAHGGGTWQGQTCDWVSLTELQPSGPVALLVFMAFSSNAGTGRELSEYAGKIGKVAEDGSFSVRFTGTKRNFRSSYRREGDNYLLAGGEALDGC